MEDKIQYAPAEFEAKMMELWEKEKTYTTGKSKIQVPNSNSSEKAYCLSMFPYPSGAGLHVGHVRIYTGTDVMARYFRMIGKDVLHPMGWDAFGLPAENAAIKAKKNPIDMVPGNIANFKRQMNMLGLSYDWNKEFSTTDPSYYKWTQWLFMQFFKMGLLYKKNTPIHWCPKCKTGLAEEEVLANGTHERCGSVITKKELPQWIFRITAYAEQLLEDLKLLDWPKGILEMQRNWIGKKTGINITYSIENTEESLTCFTTRPDTNFGATFIVIAPEHPLIQKLIDGKIKTDETQLKGLQEYREKSAAKSEMERASEGKKKTGAFTGLYAINNLNGKKLPIWTSDFVLMGFGTGAVVGVPASDIRDFEFAIEYNIPIVRVIYGKDGYKGEITKKDQVCEEGTLMNSQFLDGLKREEAIPKMMDYIESKGWGKRSVTYHLRDWIFSRQRYWGEPIPMVHCETCEKKGSDTNAIIIHGTWGSGEGNWFPWLVNHFKQSGVKAVSPTLPDAKLPHYETRNTFIKEKYSEYLKESSIVIGHSSGAGTALHLAQQHKIDQLVLVAPVLYIDESYKEELKNAFDEKTANAMDVLYNKHKIDWESVKKNVRKITVVFGENDPYLPKEMKSFAEKIVGKENVFVLAGKAHFSSSTKDAPEQFELLRFIENRMVGGWTMIEEKNLPLELPYTKSYEPTDTGESPLSAISGFSDAICPVCGGSATRETDTMPNWAGSCWYFIRFAMQNSESVIPTKVGIQNNKENSIDPVSQLRLKASMGEAQHGMTQIAQELTMQEEWQQSMGNSQWAPVDWYLGGAEHAVLHLLYARFWVKALRDLGLLHYPEPFLRLRNVGMVLAEDHRKMSKSWGNTINPDDVVAQYGADTLRMYEMFMAPFNMEIAWSTAALQGGHRFLKRVWALYENSNSKLKFKEKSNPELVDKLNKTIQKVGEDIAQTKFNTAIASLMEFLNAYEAHPELSREEAKKFIQIIAPFAPFITEKIWRDVFGEKSSIHLSAWPTQTKVSIKDTLVKLPIQIQGKFRGVLMLAASSLEEKQVEEAVLKDEGLAKYIAGKQYKLIYVKGKICNFVLTN